MTTRVARPCGAAALVELTPAPSGWGRPLPFDPVPWASRGHGLGFTNPFTVVEDGDWRTPSVDPGSDEVLRYVLVPLAEHWELRAGNTELAAMAAGTGGTHAHMFSAAEALAAEAARTPIRTGWIYEITDDYVRIG